MVVVVEGQASGEGELYFSSSLTEPKEGGNKGELIDNI